MRSDYEPIVFDTDKAFSEVEVYAIHDLHYGSELFDEEMWNRAKKEILEQSNRFCVFVGDMMENATIGSKSDVYSQRVSPHEQQEWVAQQFTDLADRTIAIVDGNHERNRSYKTAGLFPLLTAAAIARVDDRYRPHFAVCDIGVGKRDKDKTQQVRYVLYLVHKAKEGSKTSASTSLATSGIDVVISGHDHRPADLPKAQLAYNSINKVVSLKPIESINAGSWCRYDNYTVDNGYLPNSTKKYKLLLHGGSKKVETIGFYV